MFSAKLVATTIALFTLAKASPVLQARSCIPNFQGNPLTIFRTDAGTTLEWVPTSVAVGAHITLNPTSTPFTSSNFLTADSGQPDGSFVFKFVYTCIFFPVDMDAKFKPFSKIDWLPILPTQLSCKVSLALTSASNPYNLPESTSSCLFFFLQGSNFNWSAYTLALRTSWSPAIPAYSLVTRRRWVTLPMVAQFNTSRLVSV